MILCIGEILADLIGEKENGIMKYSRYPGGAPLNLAAGISKLNGDIGFIGNVGNDIIGNYLKEFASSIRFNYLDVTLDNKHNTTLAFVDIDENGERHFAFNRFNSADYQIEFNRLEVIKDADIIHVGSLMLREKEGIELARYIYKKAKELNKKISFDVNFRDDIYTSKEEAINIYLEFIKEADILKFSEEEIELFTNNKNVKEGLKTLVNEEQLVFVSLGSKGSYYQYKGESATVETFKVKPVDTTGAGDAFYACILAYLDKVDNRNKSTIIEIIKHANICGALACFKKGSLSSLPTSEELKDRYNDLY